MSTSFHHLANIILNAIRSSLTSNYRWNGKPKIDKKLSNEPHLGGILKNTDEIVNKDFIRLIYSELHFIKIVYTI